MAGPTVTTQAVLVYDAQCALCQGGVSWISRRVVRGGLQFLPCQAAERRERFPWMDEGSCLEAMQLVLPDGRVLAGDAAIPEILKRLRGWRWVALLFRLPGVTLVAPHAYAWIARRRYRISCMFGRSRG